MTIDIPKEYQPALEMISQMTDTYVVGGYIRDSLMGVLNDDVDIDVAIHGSYIDQIAKKAEENGYTVNRDGLKFGVITIYIDKTRKIDVAQFRNEIYIENSRKPIVEKSDNINDDLSRRDFTISAIAYKYPSGQIIDMFGGISDMKKKIIRCVGNPNDRFREDPLRILRALRFATRFNFEIEENTMNSIIANASRLSIVSGERIREELMKSFSYDPERFFMLLEKSKILYQIFPEYMNAKEIVHDNRYGHYSENLIQHVMDMLKKHKTDHTF